MKPPRRTPLRRGAGSAQPLAPDAELIRQCAEVIAWEQQAIAGWRKGGKFGAVNAKVVADKQAPLLAAIGAAVACTDAGIVAKLRVLGFVGPGLVVGHGLTDPEGLVLVSAMRDAVGSIEGRPDAMVFEAARARKRDLVEACRLAAEALHNLRDYQELADERTRKAGDLWFRFFSADPCVAGDAP